MPQSGRAADAAPEERDDQIADVCGVYREALRRVAAGERVLSTVTRWHFVADNLNTHCSESLVRYVAQVSGLPTTWASKNTAAS